MKQSPTIIKVNVFSLLLVVLILETTISIGQNLTATCGRHCRLYSFVMLEPWYGCDYVFYIKTLLVHCLGLNLTEYP